MNRLIAAYLILLVSPAVAAEPLIIRQSTTLTEDLTFEGNGIYLAGRNITLDGGGHTIYVKGKWGVILYAGFHHQEISPVITSANPTGCTIRNIKIVVDGGLDFSSGVYGYRGSNAKIENCEITVRGGVDPSAVRFLWQAAHLSDCVLTVEPDKSKPTNRHQLPANVDWKGGTITRCCLVGGNSGVSGENAGTIQQSVVAHDSYVTNGYATHGKETRDCLLIPTHGRGVAFSHANSAKGINNVILCGDYPNAEYGEKLNAAALRSRYDTTNCVFEGNTTLSLGAGPYCGASGMFLTNEDKPGNRFVNNHMTAIVVGPTNDNNYAQAMSIEGNKPGHLDEISGNTFRSNHRLIRTEGNDGWCSQVAPVHHNRFEKVSAKQAVEDFCRAAQAKLDSLTLTDICRQAAQGELDRRAQTLRDLAANAPAPTFHFWRPKWYRPKDANINLPTSLKLLDNEFGPGVDVRSYDKAGEGGIGGLDILVGNTVSGAPSWDFQLTKPVEKGTTIALVELDETLPEPIPEPEP